jgi:hypothetical protein
VIGRGLGRFERDVLLDSLNEATALYWERRAAQILSGLPRPDDLPGAVPDPGRVDRIVAAAIACRNHARLLRGDLHG